MQFDHAPSSSSPDSGNNSRGKGKGKGQGKEQRFGKAKGTGKGKGKGSRSSSRQPPSQKKPTLLHHDYTLQTLRKNKPLVGYLFSEVSRVEKEKGPPSAPQTEFSTPSTKEFSTPRSPSNPSYSPPSEDRANDKKRKNNVFTKLALSLGARVNGNEVEKIIDIGASLSVVSENLVNPLIF